MTFVACILQLFGGSTGMKPNIIVPGTLAPDFELQDVQGNLVRLSDFRGKKPVVLAFLRGFM
jgi:peroxiredoxin